MAAVNFGGERMTRCSDWPCVLVLFCLIVIGCGSGEESASQANSSTTASNPATANASEGAGGASPTAMLDQGRELYRSRCSTCHGESGAGDGPGGAALTPPPRDLTDAAWQASVDDERIGQVISYGGAAIGLSPMMPSQPDLANRPEELEALVAYVRAIGPQRP